MRGVGTAPTLTAAAAPAPVLSPRMVGPWLRGPCPVRPHPRVSSVREQWAAGAIRWPGWWWRVVNTLPLLLLENNLFELRSKVFPLYYKQFFIAQYFEDYHFDHKIPQSWKTKYLHWNVSSEYWISNILLFLSCVWIDEECLVSFPFLWTWKSLKETKK